MVKSRFLNVCLVAVVAIVFCLSLGTTVSAQYLPSSYYYTAPLAFPSYGYFNSIDGYLLGYNAFNPFLAPATSSAYNLAGIPTFGYLSNPFSTTFPYATLDVFAPYAPPVYPTFTYGAPDIFSLWLGLNL